MSSCGCSVMKASGDPNGRSISNLGGLGRVKRPKKAKCRYVTKGGKRVRVCPKKTSRKKRSR